MDINNKLKEKRKGSNTTGIVLIRIAAFAFAIVSWKATADGLSKYVFESDWQSGLVSFAIQTILFVFNLKLPFYFAKIGELAPDREKKKYRFGTNKGREKKKYKITMFQRVIIGFYCVTLLSSSFFSFVYICNYVVYEHQSGYVDDNAILNSLYRKVLNDTYKYVREDMKVKQILAGKILGELSEDYFSEIGENTTLSKQELIDNVSMAQDAYDIAETEYNISEDTVKAYNNEMESYATSRNKTTWHDRQDGWEKKYKAAEKKWKEAVGDMKIKKEDYKTAKENLTEAKSALANYKDSDEKIIADFLLEMLEVNPSAENLKQCISKLNDRIAELEKNSDLVENYSELVGTTQSLTAIVNEYLSLREVLSDKTGINVMLEDVEDNIVAPDPKSESFKVEYLAWKEMWQSKLNSLEDLIQQLPGFSENEKRELEMEVIDTDLLEKYNINEKMDILDELLRNKVSDINIIEKVCSLLFGKYWFIAWFSLALAVFFDLSSLLAGLFIYGISKRTVTKEIYLY